MATDFSIGVSVRVDAKMRMEKNEGFCHASMTEKERLESVTMVR